MTAEKAAARKRWEEGGFLQRDQPSCGTIFWRKKRYLDAAQLVTRLELGRWSGATKTIRNNTLASAPAQGCTLRTPSGYANMATSRTQALGTQRATSPGGRISQVTKPAAALCASGVQKRS